MLQGLWNIIVTLFFLTMLLSFAAMSMHEHVRWNECSDECDSHRIINWRLLASDICKSNEYGSKALEMCQAAMRENSRWHFSCTAMLYWQKSEVNRIYSMYAESHWMLFGITSIAVTVFIHQLFSVWKTRPEPIVTCVPPPLPALPPQQIVFQHMYPRLEHRLQDSYSIDDGPFDFSNHGSEKRRRNENNFYE